MSIQGPTSGGTYFPPSDFTVNTPGTPQARSPHSVPSPSRRPRLFPMVLKPTQITPRQARARPPAMCARRWPTCPPTKCRPTCTP